MNELLHSLSYISAGAAGALFSAIWQGAVLAACVALVLRLFPGLSAAARSVIWLNVFVLLALLHFVPVLMGHAGSGAGGRLSTVYLDLRWSFPIAATWAVLSLVRAGQLVVGAIHLRGLARRAVSVAVDVELQALLEGARGKRAATLCTSDEVARPSVLGFFRPRILVPPVLLEMLSGQELKQVVLHEMEHLHRADDWTNLLQKIGLVLFPLNPVLLWVDRRLSAERELACDDRVLQSNAGRKAYALCLAHLAEYSILRRSFSLVLGAWERRPELVKRVQRILQQPVQSMRRRPAIAATGGVLAAALGMALGLSHSPQLVSFVPMRPYAQAHLLDPHELGRELGGTPQLVKATMPTTAAVEPAITGKPGPRSGEKPLRPAVIKHLKPQRVEPTRTAQLAPELNPIPTLGQHELVVLTEWRIYEAPPRVVLAVAPGQPAPRAVMIPATYAILPTPNGWLIIQI